MISSGCRILGLALICHALAGPLFAQPPPPTAITVVSDDNYPPYIFRDAHGELRGILPDQWTLWEKKTGVKVILKAMDWAEAQRLMREGLADVIDTMFRTPEREQLFAFTPPYAEIRVPIFHHRELGGIADYTSLHGFTVGVKAGDAVIGKLAEHGIETVKEYPSYESLIQAAKNDEIKVFSIDEPAATYYLYKHGAASDYLKSFVLYTGQFHRAVQKSRPDLLALIDNGFEKISPREYEAIDDKWMGTPVAWTLVLRRYGALFWLATAVLLLLFGGNLILRRQIRIRTTELRDSRARLENILRLAPVGICVVRRRVILEANDIFCNTLALPPERVVGQSTRIIYVSDDDFHHYGHEFYDQIARQGFVTIEIQTRRSNGQPLIILVSGAPLDPKRPNEEIIFSALDITKRKQSEEELRKSREYFSTLYNSLADAVFIDDATTGQILDVNQRMIEMYGFSSREEAIAVGLAPLCSGTPPYSAAEAAEWIRKAREEGPQVFEWHARHRDGHLFWVEVSIRRFQIGPDDRLIVSVRDITERKTQEDERRQYERRLQETQKFESLGLLAGGIAHDFNNLLTAILGNIDLALLDIPNHSTARDDLLTAMTATRRAAELAQQMLAYSGRGRFVIERVSVPTAIREIIQMLKASISKNAHLDLHFPESLPEIEVDATQLRQVIMNLVLNASEALNDQAGTIRIAAGMIDGNALPPAQIWPHESLAPVPHLYIEVADTGSGMSPDVIEKIFDPFFSTKFFGRGLGLCAVLGIVRGHKGAIQVDSTPGKGTTFRVYFPTCPEPPSGLSSTQSPTPPPAHAGLLLLVDDEADVRNTAAKLLARLGYQVLCAADGEQAISLFRGQAPRISGVILDLTMPHLDGVQTLAQLRSIRHDVPAIISSGYSEQDVLQRFAGMKVQGFISKPYTLAGLRASLADSFSSPPA